MNPTFVIEMENGQTMKGELYPDVAPNSAANYIELANSGFYDNGFNNPLKHTRGVLSMARSMMPNSAGSQFFVMVDDAPYLDGQYAAFGKVTEGMETADAIVSVPRDAMDKPYEDQKMKSVRVETYGVEYPVEKIKGRG